MNGKFLAIAGGIITVSVPYLFGIYLLFTGQTTIAILSEAFTSPDPIYVISQRYVDSHNVIVVPGADTPIGGDSEPVEPAPKGTLSDEDN